MTDVQLVDVSIRDGNQSLWGAVGMTTRMIAGAAPDLDQVGYRAIEAASSTLLFQLKILKNKTRLKELFWLMNLKFQKMISSSLIM